MYMYSSLNTIIKNLHKFKSDSLPQGLIAVGPAGREDKYKIRNPTEPTTGRWPSAGDQIWALKAVPAALSGRYQHIILKQ